MSYLLTRSAFTYVPYHYLLIAQANGLLADYGYNNSMLIIAKDQPSIHIVVTYV